MEFMLFILSVLTNLYVMNLFYKRINYLFDARNLIANRNLDWENYSWLIKYKILILMSLCIPILNYKLNQDSEIITLIKKSNKILVHVLYIFIFWAFLLFIIYH